MRTHVGCISNIKRQTRCFCQTLPSIQTTKMNIAFVLLLSVAAVSSFTAVERAGSGAGLENQDVGDLFEYEAEYDYGSGLDRFVTYLYQFAYEEFLDLDRLKFSFKI